MAYRSLWILFSTLVQPVSISFCFLCYSSTESMSHQFSELHHETEPTVDCLPVRQDFSVNLHGPGTEAKLSSGI